MTQRRRKRATSYITGEKGTNRVRLFPHARDGKLFVEFRDEGKRRAVALGHDDFNRGKAQADEIALKLRQNETPKSGALTLKGLFERYECEVTGTKSVGSQKHDRRTRILFEQCWGPNTKVADLDRRDWDRFIQQRRSGALAPAGRARKKERDGKAPKPQGVRDRVIEYDLRLMLAVCNWAMTVRENSKPLLDRNPFAGFAVPKEENPDRPIVTAEELVALERAAAVEGPDVELYLLLVRETGHRCTAVGRVRWSDVDLANGKIRWRAEHDKMGREHIVLLSDAAKVGLAQVEQRRKATGRIGDGWLFPSPTDPESPIRRDLLRDWWEKIEKRSGIERIRGRGWHSLRRLFATELKDTPLADLCYMGGWRDPQTVLKCYMRPDEGTMRRALEKRAGLRAAAGQ